MGKSEIPSSVFILGVQRAGTTLLHQLLSANGQLKVIERETHLFILLWNKSGKLQFNNNQELGVFLMEALPKVNKGWTNEHSYKVLREITEAVKDCNKKIETPEELMKFFLNYWQAKNPDSLVGEKTPGHIFYLDILLKNFPDARFVVMMRDPRACYLSENIKLQNAAQKPNNLFKFAIRWSSVSFLARTYSTIHPRQVKVFRYEDLILQPEQTLRSVCDFLNIDFHESMLKAKVTNSSFQDKTQTDKEFNVENIDRWKTLLKPEDASLLEKSLKKEIHYWKYPTTSPRLKFRNFLKVIILKLLIKISLWFCALNAPMYHHLNRNKKYRIKGK